MKPAMGKVWKWNSWARIKAKNLFISFCLLPCTLFLSFLLSFFFIFFLSFFFIYHVIFLFFLPLFLVLHLFFSFVITFLTSFYLVYLLYFFHLSFLNFLTFSFFISFIISVCVCTLLYYCTQQCVVKMHVQLFIVQYRKCCKHVHILLYFEHNVKHFFCINMARELCVLNVPIISESQLYSQSEESFSSTTNHMRVSFQQQIREEDNY